MSSADILERIVASKADDVAELRRSRGRLASAADFAPPAKPVLESLAERETVAVFAEVKRRSPGAGTIDSALDPVELSATYEAGGASAISVLTDSAWFGGSLADLTAVGRARSLPVLRKDFVVDPVQLFEARAAGADLVLLIARIVRRAVLAELCRLAHGLGMTALVEVHDEREIEAAVAAGASLIGVNNRDLATFKTDLAVTERLARYVPADLLLVSESGVSDREDVERVAAAGADAVLVGEALVRSGSPAEAVREMASVPKLARR